VSEENETTFGMATCVAFIGVPDIAATIKWYEDIGFQCTGTNHIWEPGCELNWAELDWEGATFMLYPLDADFDTSVRHAGLYFQVNSIGIVQKLRGKVRILELVDKTFYGRKEVVFKDLNGFQVTFSCEPDND
jgi:catechol 2,3-dioxygenase-like lactoylglutathione lyase family enzyme